jgi:Uma2 family endonuclease
LVVKAPRLLSEEEFLDLPDSPGKQELLDGELVELPPAKYSHNELTKRIYALLLKVLDASQVWSENGYRLSRGCWLQPGVSVTRPDQRIENDWYQGAPMIAIEVASRGYTPDQLEKKRLLYLEAGAAEVWLVYPKTRSMLVSRKDSTFSIDPDANYRCELIGLTVTPQHRTPVR